AGAAVAHEGQRHAGQRDEPGDASDDEEGLERERRRETAGEELREAVDGAGGDREAAPHQKEEAEDDGYAAEVAELAGDAAEDEVGGQGRDDVVAVGIDQEAASEPGAHHTAVAERIQRLHELVAAAGRVLEGMEPGVDAVG